MQRLCALFFTVLLFSGIGTDAFALDPCPHHSLAAPAADTASRSSHAGHGAHDTDPAAEQGHAAACTCMGSCATAAAIAVPVAPSLQIAVVYATGSLSVAPSADAPASLHLAFLPYGIAPPASPSSIQG